MRSVLVLLAAVTLGGVAMAAVYGVEDGLQTAFLLAVMGVPVLVAVALVARHRHRLGSLTWQLGLGVVLVIGLDLIGVQVVATLLFVSAHDAFTMALLLLFAATLGGYAAWRLTRGVTRDIAAVQAAVDAVGRGGHERVGLGAADEVGDLAGAVDRLARQLADRETERDASEQARRDLITAVSHDLRTPLNSLRLIARAIDDGLVDEHSLRHWLGQIAFHVKSLDTLVEDLFELGRIEAGDAHWSFESLPLEELMRETVEGLGPLAHEREVALRFEIAPGLAPVRANPEKIQRVLFNLVENALHYTPRGGDVVLSARAGGAAVDVEVEVADTGPGIPAADHERVFEPLFRGGAVASRPRNGAGLGLPISRSIVEVHGGRMHVAESSPRGTRIRFTLPRAGQDEERRTRNSAPDTANNAAETSSQRSR